MNILLEQDFT